VLGPAPRCASYVREVDGSISGVRCWALLTSSGALWHLLSERNGGATVVGHERDRALAASAQGTAKVGLAGTKIKEIYDTLRG